MGKQTTIKITPKVERYEIFAICSKLDFFRFCTTLNGLFSIDLQGQKPLNVTKNGNNLQLPYFAYHNPNNNMTVTVVENKINDLTLIEFYKNIPYFVKVSPIISDMQIDDLQKKLQSIDNFSFIQRIQYTSLSKQQVNTLNSIFQFL